MRLHRFLLVVNIKRELPEAEMLVLLDVPPHNVPARASSRFAERLRGVRRYGTLCFVCDLMSVGGIVELDRRGLCGVIVRELLSHSGNDPNT
jgi:hypothetical protein